jgi:hypothetical protein
MKDRSELEEWSWYNDIEFLARKITSITKQVNFHNVAPSNPFATVLAS